LNTKSTNQRFEFSAAVVRDKRDCPAVPANQSQIDIDYLIQYSLPRSGQLAIGFLLGLAIELSIAGSGGRGDIKRRLLRGRDT
jgi:hypothetical protein